MKKISSSEEVSFFRRRGDAAQSSTAGPTTGWRQPGLQLQAFSSLPKTRHRTRRSEAGKGLNEGILNDVEAVFIESLGVPAGVIDENLPKPLTGNVLSRQAGAIFALVL